MLRNGQAAHGAVHGVGLVVEVLHAPQRRARQAALVADAAAVVADLLRERQEQRLVAQAVQVLVRVRVDDLRAGALGSRVWEGFGAIGGGCSLRTPRWQLAHDDCSTGQLALHI